MALGKWIGGVLGFMSAGPLGALAGIVIGGLFDNVLDAVNTPETQGTFDSPFGQQQAQQRASQGQRNSFLFSMLVLASCSTTRYVPEDRTLLNSVSVKTLGDYPQVNTATLRNYVRQ